MHIKNKLLTSVGVGAFLMSGAAFAADQPTYDTAVIDGDYSEWNLVDDFFANMYEAGNPTKTLLSKAYLRYDCNSHTMFALVLREGSHVPDQTADNAWFKTGESGGSPLVDGGDDNGGTPTGNPPEFSWAYDGSGNLVGYEASFSPLYEGTYTIEIHINVDGGDTSSTGKSPNRIQVSVVCGNEPPDDPAIDVETSTNGHDADDPTGPVLTEGDPVTWECVVTNTGNVPLTNVTVTSPDVTLDCSPKTLPTTLAVGETMTCTASGTAQLGQNTVSCSATGDYGDETVEDTDPSNYYGEDDTPEPMPAIEIEKSTNGIDADDPTGPTILEGQTVTWEYIVTNIGNVDLTNVTVTDDQGVTVSCSQSTLIVGGTMTCTASGTATANQYANVGTAEGDYIDPNDGTTTTVNDTDPSHYFGADPSLDIEKWTQGQDADNATGPYIEVDDVVYWLYTVTNTGNVDLTNVVVTDNQGVTLDCGDGDNTIESLLIGEIKTCSGQDLAISGQYSNEGTATTTYTDDSGNQETVTDDDPSHYFGAEPGIDIEKSTNGENADTTPGPFVIEGDTITWTYVVTNTGNIPLANIGVVDTPDCALYYVSGDTNGDDMLDLDETWTYECSGLATLYQYTNTACTAGDYTVTIPNPDEDPANPDDDYIDDPRTAEDCDDSHYYGFISNQPSLEVFGLTFTISGDANQYVNGSFVIENASDGPEVQAIGVTEVDLVIEYRDGNKWVEVAETCTYDPEIPFVLEGPDGTQGTISFECTTEDDQIPLDANAVRVTAEVNIFNRGKTFRYKESLM